MVLMSRNILVLLFLILVVMTLFLSYFYLSRAAITTSTRATQKDFSTQNSYIFISPLSAQAGGGEKIRVNTFILDSRGIGVQGLIVSFDSMENLGIEAIQSTTDSSGKAVFNVAATQAGDYYLELIVNGNRSGLKAHLNFRLN